MRICLFLVLILSSCATIAGRVHDAVEAGDATLLTALIDGFGEDVNEIEDSETPLDRAIASNKLHIASLLRMRGGLSYVEWLIHKDIARAPKLLMSSDAVDVSFETEFPEVAHRDETFTCLLKQLPVEFFGRHHAHFYQVAVIKSFKRMTKEPFIKVKYRTFDENPLATWVIVSSNDPANHRELWEVLGEDEPVMSFDPNPPGIPSRYPFRFSVLLDAHGMMNILAETRNENGQSQYLNAKKEFERSVSYFGKERVNGIDDYWSSTGPLCDNYVAFKCALAFCSPELAAFETHTGRQAKRLGFKQVDFDERSKRKIRKGVWGRNSELRVLFFRSE